MQDESTDRRSVLKSIGVATTAGVGVLGTSGTAAAAECDGDYGGACDKLVVNGNADTTNYVVKSEFDGMCKGPKADPNDSAYGNVADGKIYSGYTDDYGWGGGTFNEIRQSDSSYDAEYSLEYANNCIGCSLDSYSGYIEISGDGYYAVDTHDYSFSGNLYGGSDSYYIDYGYAYNVRLDGDLLFTSDVTC